MNLNNLNILFTDAMTPYKFMRLCPNTGKTLIIDITKEDILTKEMSNIYSWINTLLRVDYAKECRVNLSIHGYNDDIREAYEIPEIVDYIKLLFNKKPELYYFLDLMSKQFVMICYSLKSYNAIDDIEREIMLDKNKVLDFMQNITAKIVNNNRFNHDDELFLLSDLQYIMTPK